MGQNTVYFVKYAHGFVVFCLLWLIYQILELDQLIGAEQRIYASVK